MKFIKQLGYQFGITLTVGAGTLILIEPIQAYAGIVLKTSLAKLVVGAILVSWGLYLARKYGKKYDVADV